MQQIVNAEVDQMLADDIIEPSDGWQYLEFTNSNGTKNRWQIPILCRI